MAQPKPTAVIYCRTSTANQKEAETIVAQVERCRTLVERHGVKLLPYGHKRDGWLVDDGVSGSLLEGRTFAKFVDDLEARKIRPDFLIVFSLSRIGRLDKSSRDMTKLVKSATDNARIKAVLLGAGVKLIDEDGVNDPATVMFDLKLTLSTEEYKLIRLRTMGGKARRLAEGRFAKGGKPPYGYVQVPVNGVDRKQGWTLAPHADEAARLRQLLAWYVEGGATYAAGMATKAKYPTPMHRTTKRKNAAKDWTSTRWSPVSVQHIARNVRSYLGESTLLFDGKPHTIKFPPLIDLKTYAAVDRRKKERTLKRRATMLSTGLVDCSCGEHVQARNSHGIHYTRCPAGCGAIREATFSSVLWVAVMARHVQITESESASPAPVSTDAAKAKLKETEDAVDRLLGLYLPGKIDEATFERQNTQLAEQRARAKAELARLEAEHEHAERKAADEGSIKARVDAVLSELLRSEPTLARKREILRNLLGGERVIVRWPKKKERDECSAWAAITLPAFGSLAEFTLRTDQNALKILSVGRVREFIASLRKASTSRIQAFRRFLDFVARDRDAWTDEEGLAILEGIISE